MAFPILGSPKPQFLDSSGDPYASGTLSVLEPTDDSNKTYYPTADDADAGTNGASGDITLNSSGSPTNALFGVDDQKYKLVLKDSSGSTIWTVDDIRLPVRTPTLYGKTAQTLTDAGAVTLTESTTFLVTTGAAAITLADGVENQEKFIVMKTDGGAATLTPTNFSNGTTVVFDDVGDSAHLIFIDGSWNWIGGTATGPSVISDTAASSTNPAVFTSGIPSFDVSSLTSLTAANLAGADLFFVDDGGGGTNKSIAWQDFGVPQTDDATTTPLSAADLTYANRIYNCNNASAISAVIPANASVAFPVGTVLGFYQQGAGQVTVSVTSDTLNAPNGAKTSVQHSTIFARKIASTTWVMSGDTTT